VYDLYDEAYTIYSERQCMICPKKGGGSNFLDHRSSKLGKLQALKVRSCDCRRQEAPYD